MRRDRRLRPGNLLTGEERFLLRVIAEDLRKEIERCRDPLYRSRLEVQLANVEMERENDRQCRPTRPKGRRK